MKPVVVAIALAVALTASSLAQQTVFNVPSGDVLQRGKAYGELDVAYRHSDASAAFTPRLVVGIGHHVETGVNVSGLNAPGPQQTTISPTIKWKAYDGGSNGWTALLGDNFNVPVQNRTYNVGNYAYAELAKTLSIKTRFTVGAYHFSRNVVARAQRAGGQFAIEQLVSDRLTLAADWYTGDHSLGYVTPGFLFKLTRKLTWYAAYQVGNQRATKGNHQFLSEIGLNLK